jgi:hypothetical protein
MNELNQPYNKEYDSIQPYNAYGFTYAQFMCDWETEFVQEEGQQYKRFMEKCAQEKMKVQSLSLDNNTAQETKEVPILPAKLSWLKSIQSYMKLN